MVQAMRDVGAISILISKEQSVLQQICYHVRELQWEYF